MAPLSLKDDDVDELSMDVEDVPWEECVRTEHEFTGMQGYRRALENIFLKYGKPMDQGQSATVSFSRDDEYFDVEGEEHLELLPTSTLDDPDDDEWEECGDEWVLGDVADGDDRTLNSPDLSEEERKALWTLPDIDKPGLVFHEYSLLDAVKSLMPASSNEPYGMLVQPLFRNSHPALGSRTSPEGTIFFFSLPSQDVHRSTTTMSPMLARALAPASPPSIGPTPPGHPTRPLTTPRLIEPTTPRNMTKLLTTPTPHRKPYSIPSTSKLLSKPPKRPLGVHKPSTSSPHLGKRPARVSRLIDLVDDSASDSESRKYHTVVYARPETRAGSIDLGADIY